MLAALIASPVSGGAMSAVARTAVAAPRPPVALHAPANRGEVDRGRSHPRTVEDWQIENWQVEEGLPENSATEIVQDQDGYLWFGTFRGLVRFDGVRFEVFEPGNTPELPSSSVVNLHLDRSGRLWVFTSRGIAMRDRTGWRRIGGESLAGGVRSVAERPDGVMLLTSFEGQVEVFDGTAFAPLQPSEVRRVGPIAAVDGAGRWWLTQRGLLSVHHEGRWIAPVGADAPETETMICAPARDGGVWTIARRSISRYASPTSRRRWELPVDLRGLWSGFEDSTGSLWICTHDNGLFRWTPPLEAEAAGELLHWTTASGLTYNGVRCVFEDREGSIWVGTSGGGLLRFSERRCRTFGVEHGITEPIVRSIALDQQGGLLVGTYGGGLFHLRAGVASMVPLGGRGGYVQSVLADGRGRWWIGTFGDGLFLIEGSELRSVPAKRTGGSNILALFEDSRARVWVAGGNGLACFHSDRLDGVESDVFGEAEGVPDAGIGAILEDAAGTIWFSNDSGVFRLDGDRFVEVIDQFGRSLAEVTCLVARPDGSLWFGSRSAGLLRYRAGQVEGIGATLDAAAQSVRSIVIGDDGYWWLGTGRGIVRVAERDLVEAAEGRLDRVPTRTLGRLDGLATLECSGGRQPLSARDAEGRLWFATQRGVAMVDPRRIRRNALAPPVVIEEVRTIDQDGADRVAIPANTTDGERGSGAPLNDRVIDVPAGSRQIDIRYAALSFVDPAQMRFELMLEGIDREWRAVGSERSARFGSLAPGDHRFRVRAANEDGLWNETGAAITLRVAPLLWQTGWFRFLAASLLVGAGGAGAWWLASLRERRRQRAEERIRVALEASPSGMVLVDASGAMVLVNAQIERSFGTTRDRLIGRPIDTLIPERFASVHEAIRMAVRSDFADDVSARRADGSEFPVEVGVRPIEAGGGPLALVSLYDLSERKRAEAELARQRDEVAHLSRVNMLGELSGAIAHEINQPLTAILSNAQAAQRFMRHEPVNFTEVQAILEDIIAEDRRAGEVIQRLRTLLRKGEVLHEPLVVEELVRDALRLLRRELFEKGVTVDLAIPQGLPPVRGDRIQLQQVLLNLVMNACDAMERTPRGNRLLRITADRAVPAGMPGDVRVTVRDSGGGIDAEHLDRLFTPFFTTKGAGMGLGLSVCRTILAAHDGAIWVTNEPTGGACVHVTLRCDEAHGAAQCEEYRS
jgi:PAS domain S-box-containing protein